MSRSYSDFQTLVKVTKPNIVNMLNEKNIYGIRPPFEEDLIRSRYYHTRPGGKTYPIPKGIEGWAEEWLYFCLKPSQPPSQQALA